MIPELSNPPKNLPRNISRLSKPVPECRRAILKCTLATCLKQWSNSRLSHTKITSLSNNEVVATRCLHRPAFHNNIHTKHKSNPLSPVHERRLEIIFERN